MRSQHQVHLSTPMELSRNAGQVVVCFFEQVNLTLRALCLGAKKSTHLNRFPQISQIYAELSLLNNMNNELSASAVKSFLNFCVNSVA